MDNVAYARYIVRESIEALEAVANLSDKEITLSERLAVIGKIHETRQTLRVLEDFHA